MVVLSSFRDDFTIPEFYGCFLQKGSEALAVNVKTTLELIKIDDKYLPLTINDTEWENSYVVSPYGIIPYVEEEMKRHRFVFLKWIFWPILAVIKKILKTCAVNRVVMINNHLLSTNLYPKLSSKEVQKVHDYILRKYPDHTLIFRSLNRCLEGQLMRNLKQLGYGFITNRSIYLFSYDEIKDKGIVRRRIKRDGALLEKNGVKIISHDEFSESDALDIKNLYDLLYLKKYSYQNPQFTEEFFRLAITRKTFHLTGISHQGKLVGVIGSFKRKGVITFPIVGYDMSYPQSFGLYRMLSYLMLEEAKEGNFRLHMSSGVGEFKRGRGGVQEIESMAVYVSHLPFYRRLPWKAFSVLLNSFGEKIVLRHEL